MRLFASLAPSAQARAHLESAVAAIRGPVDARSPLRWTDPDLWHVTLAFYGEVPDGVVPGLTEALADRLDGLAAPRLALRGAGSFAGRNLWTGVAGEEAGDGRALAALVEESVAAGDDVGIGRDERPRHRAHLTLARVGNAGSRRRDPGPDVSAAVRALSVYAGPAWSADAVHLVRSRLGQGRSGGPLHEDVAILPLL